MKYVKLYEEYDTYNPYKFLSEDEVNAIDSLTQDLCDMYISNSDYDFIYKLNVLGCYIIIDIECNIESSNVYDPKTYSRRSKSILNLTSSKEYKEYISMIDKKYDVVRLNELSNNGVSLIVQRKKLLESWFFKKKKFTQDECDAVRTLVEDLSDDINLNLVLTYDVELSKDLKSIEISIHLLEKDKIKTLMKSNPYIYFIEILSRKYKITYDDDYPYSGGFDKTINYAFGILNIKLTLK